MKYDFSNYRAQVRMFQRAYWDTLLRLTKWNVTQAADIAGVDRTHAYRLLRELGIFTQGPI